MTSRLTWWLFLATVFTITFAKLHWAVAGDVALADVLTILFLGAFAVIPATSATSVVQ